MVSDCEVKGCTGTYETKVISYTQLRTRKEITIEEYNSLESTKGYHAVVSQHCNVCNDDLEQRLLSFINTNFKG